MHAGPVQAHPTGWPANPDEQRNRDQQLRAAVERTAYVLGYRS